MSSHFIVRGYIHRSYVVAYFSIFMVVNSRLSITYSGVSLQHSGLCMADHIYHRLSNSRQLIVKGEQLFLQEDKSPQCFKGLLVIIPTLLIAYVFFSYIYCFLFTGSNYIPHSRGNIILKFSIYLELDILHSKYQGIKFHHFRFHKD